MKRMTAQWVRKAEADYQAAVGIHRGGGRLHDVVCFHCQQTAEKYLKALMEERGLSVPKIHDLDDLRAQLLPHYTPLPPRRGMVFLRRFAVDIRYPGDRARKREADAAVRWAGKVRAAVRTLLGLPAGRAPWRKKSP